MVKCTQICIQDMALDFCAWSTFCITNLTLGETMVKHILLEKLKRSLTWKCLIISLLSSLPKEMFGNTLIGKMLTWILFSSCLSASCEHRKDANHHLFLFCGSTRNCFTKLQIICEEDVYKFPEREVFENIDLSAYAADRRLGLESSAKLRWMQ